MKRVKSVLNVEAYRHTTSRIISSYNNETVYDIILTLLLNLFDNNLKQSQYNTVFVQQEKWTGWWEDLNPRSWHLNSGALINDYGIMD